MQRVFRALGQIAGATEDLEVRAIVSAAIGEGKDVVDVIALAQLVPAVGTAPTLLLEDLPHIKNRVLALSHVAATTVF